MEGIKKSPGGAANSTRGNHTLDAVNGESILTHPSIPVQSNPQIDPNTGLPAGYVFHEPSREQLAAAAAELAADKAAGDDYVPPGWRAPSPVHEPAPPPPQEQPRADPTALDELFRSLGVPWPDVKYDELVSAAVRKGVTLAAVFKRLAEARGPINGGGMAKAKLAEIATYFNDAIDERRLNQPKIATRSAHAVDLSQVVAAPVSFFWKDMVPRGSLITLLGESGVGKTAFVLDVLARITTGKPFPGESEGRAPERVAIIQGENDPARSLKPRLMAAGADLRNVLYSPKTVDAITGEKRRWSFPDDMALLAETVRQERVAMLFIDPISAFVDGDGVNLYKDSDVRDLLEPFVDLAQETGCSVVMVQHPARKGAGSESSVGAGSIAFRAAARVQLVVVPLPDSDQKVVAVEKANDFATPDPWIVRLQPVELDGSIKTIKVQYLRQDPSLDERSIRALMTGKETRDKPSPKTGEAEQFWVAQLAHGEWVPLKAVRAVGEEQGLNIDSGSFNRARKKLGIESARQLMPNDEGQLAEQVQCVRLPDNPSLKDWLRHADNKTFYDEHRPAEPIHGPTVPGLPGETQQ